MGGSECGGAYSIQVENHSNYQKVSIHAQYRLSDLCVFHGMSFRSVAGAQSQKFCKEGAVAIEHLRCC